MSAIESGAAALRGPGLTVDHEDVASVTRVFESIDVDDLARGIYEARVREVYGSRPDLAPSWDEVATTWTSVARIAKAYLVGGAS